MTGSMFIIDLPGPVAADRLAELGAVLNGLAVHFEQARVWSYDLEVEPGRLGARDPESRRAGNDKPRRITVNIAGPGFGDEGVFRAAHAEGPDLEPLIGFTPTHDVVISVDGDNVVDQLMIAELTAVVQAVVGGMIDIKLSPRLLAVVRGLPGVAAVAEATEHARLFCTAEFLRT